MNRLVVNVGRRLAALQVAHCGSNAPSTSNIRQIPYVDSDETFVRRRLGDLKTPFDVVPIELPASVTNPKVYSFPTAQREKLIAPGDALQELLEKFAPSLNKAPLELPPSRSSIEGIYAGAPRMKLVRRHKMRKHKRRKRFDRDFFIRAKYHRAKKERAEREYRNRMKALVTELQKFDPEEYVKDVIRRAKREWKTELAPTGRKLYPHWSTLMSLEELYGLPESDYIDKKAGIPDEEDREKIRELKESYYRKFLGREVNVPEKPVVVDPKNDGDEKQ